MATRIVLGHENPETGKAAELIVEETFDAVLGKLCPDRPPASALEAQASLRYTLTDGRPAAVYPQHVVWIEEAESE